MHDELNAGWRLSMELDRLKEADKIMDELYTNNGGEHGNKTDDQQR